MCASAPGAERSVDPRSATPRSGAVAQHDAGAAGAPEGAAELLGGGAAAGADAHLIERSRAAAQEPRRDDAVVASLEQLVITRRQQAVAMQHLVAGKTGGE